MSGAEGRGAGAAKRRRRSPAAAAELPVVEVAAATLAELAEAVIGWFEAAGRDLPWRRTRDPWRILVSEVMLQQIQVVRAVPFYLAFVERFPTPAALAEAPLSAAIRVWGDLGRYKRVVSLHRAARLIVAEHGGAVPSEPAALRALPGVGPYTAGAVACFAFERDEAFLETNLRRVVHRLFVGPEKPGWVANDALLLRLAAAAVPAGRGWAWNQGLMDLGATVCTARRPACERCPAATWCRARPTIGTALAAVPRKEKETGERPAYRYEDSNRFLRGRVLAQLREGAGPGSGGGIALGELGARVRSDFSAEDAAWLEGVVASLAKDGLAVAEERAGYDAGGGTGGGDRGGGAVARVRGRRSGRVGGTGVKTPSYGDEAG